MRSEVRRWLLGLIYIVSVASIWTAASFVVQSVVDVGKSIWIAASFVVNQPAVDAGVSPFLITYICSSLSVIYIPLFEIGRYLEDRNLSIFFWRNRRGSDSQNLQGSEEVFLLEQGDTGAQAELSPGLVIGQPEITHHDGLVVLEPESDIDKPPVFDDANKGLDPKGRWICSRVAKISLLICPFWFLAHLMSNLSLKYNPVTSSTILSGASSLLTFLVALAFLGEKFTWVKLVSVLLCMAGTVIATLGYSETGLSAIASNPLLGVILALESSALYAVYITLIRSKLPDDDGKSGKVSVAQFLGYLGLFNFLVFLPVALILNFTELEPFSGLTWKQVGLLVGKGMLDNVLSDYLWVKAVLLTTTTVVTAGLTIQVPFAVVGHAITGSAPKLMDYIGAAAVIVGFAGINIPSDAFSSSRSKEESIESENEQVSSTV